APDRVWAAEPYGSIEMATGGGLSTVFARPAYQDQVAGVVGQHRGVPDIAAAASNHSRIWFAVAGEWQACAGTSVAAPLAAGIVAVAAGHAGRGLGAINPLLYSVPASRLGLTSLGGGTNTANAILGHACGPGYDLVSGLGTFHRGLGFVAALSRRRCG